MRDLLTRAILPTDLYRSKKASFVLSNVLSEDAFVILVRLGLPAFVQDEYRQLDERRKALMAELVKQETEALQKLGETLRDQNPLLVDALRTEAAAVVVGTFR